LNYECLLQEATDNNLYVIENATFESDAKGLINNDVIGINKNIGTEAERACVLAEELGHYHTSSGNIIDMSNETNVKQERFARLWSYNKMIGLHGIIEAHKKGCSTRHEMANCLGVTEEFLDEAIKIYTEKYGVCTQVDNYIIFFIPSLGVMELIDNTSLYDFM